MATRISNSNGNSNSNSTKTKSKKASSSSERQVDKSPAEFFAEHQAIAGFDNPGKSLYTSIRELVENSLDACESLGVLPKVHVELVEYTQDEFNRLYGVGDSPHRSSQDADLFKKSKQLKQQKNSKKNADDTTTTTGNGSGLDNPNHTSNHSHPTTSSKKKEDAYFKLTVTDNGCGMDHKDIPNLLGKVLSGSKYGVRQTRGKFGLGAKMTLIWGKKSSGHPITIKTAHRTKRFSSTTTTTSNSNGASQEVDEIPEYVSECVLDIDIYKNEPRVLKHKKLENEEEWIGTRVEVVIAGNWTTYKSRVLLYLQQLAIITPYADLEFTYHKLSDESDKKTINIRYERRSEQMPPPAKTTKPHPSGVNNLVLQQLIQFTKATKLSKFLHKELSSLSTSLVQRILTELKYDPDWSPHDLTPTQMTRLAQGLRAVSCKGPDTSVLSPLGEYNLNLGITKVLEPDLVATARDKPGSLEGHGFLVEAAVCLGGKDGVTMKDAGLQVYRFANRIPLLFEGGADVSTRVATTQIKWPLYKIDPRQHRVGVFVSIVSTKIPFKGTSKEYIGDDALELQQSVKRALQSCCQQLRVHLVKRNAIKSAMERQSKLLKYIPDVSRSLYDLLDAMKKRKSDGDDNDDGNNDNDREEPLAAAMPTAAAASLPSKRLRVDPVASSALMRQLGQQVTPETFASCLKEAVREHMDIVEKEAEETATVPVYLVPLYNLDDSQHDINTPLFCFRPIQPVKMIAVQPQKKLEQTTMEVGTPEMVDLSCD